MRTRWYYPTKYDRYNLCVEVHVHLNRKERQRLAEAIQQNDGEIVLPFWSTLTATDVTEPVIVLTQEDDSWGQEGLSRREAITALWAMLADELAELKRLLAA